MFEELEIYDGLPPGDAVEDEVKGHVCDSPPRFGLRCWQCKGVYPITGACREDVFYVCIHCHSLNQPDFSKAPRSAPGGSPGRLQGPYRKPVVLDTVFLRGPDGALFEFPKEEAARARVGPDRFSGCGHPPYILDDGEVVGHHKTATDAAADPGAWTYHRGWEHGCYFDETSGQFCVGFHRHPFGDERAVGALESDFI